MVYVRNVCGIDITCNILDRVAGKQHKYGKTQKNKQPTVALEQPQYLTIDNESNDNKHLL